MREHDFSVLTLGEIVERLQTGENLPERCAAITVDDAFRTFLTDGWPLLKEFGYPATLFVSTDSVGGGDYLSWQELKRLADEGVEIGNHSAAHAYMLDNFKRIDWRQEVKGDLERSQAAFIRNIGYSPSLFAYPYGEYSPELIDLVKQAGFIAAFGQQSGVIASGSDLYSLPRFPMGAGYTNLDGFRSKLFMKHLPVVVVTPKSPLITEENPPKLKFYLKESNASEGTLQCFVAGQAECQLNVLDKNIPVYEVRAESPLRGRRGKYTL
nr:polysaccharide deacetylase family protein [Gammaproteobacteria bacterium]NIV70845.1 polysaccharide deacetylase family protein [Phycisphaerae bacterium]NIY20383.1 polysaccharide deacetylase family protein [Gammaproteobacteria bacterium]